MTGSGSSLERAYRLAVIVKAVDGVAELLLGLVLALLPRAPVAVLQAIADELREGAGVPRQVLADAAVHAGAALAAQGSLLVILFLLVHGTVKIATAWCLLRRIRRAYPYAIAVLAALLGVQAWDVLAAPGLFGLLVLALDAVILLIVIREYQVLRREARADQRTDVETTRPAAGRRVR